MIDVIGEKNQIHTLQLVEKALEISEQLLHQPVTLFNIDTDVIKFTYEITDYFKNRSSDYILLPSTPFFREVAAELTAKKSATLLTDCIALDVNQCFLEGTRPSLDGKGFSHYRFSDTQPGIIVIKDTGMTDLRKDWTQHVEIIDFEANTLHHCNWHTSAGKATFIKKMTHPDATKEIKDAQLIFAGGRGLMNEQSFESLRTLADYFDASIGASRPVVDCGWAALSEQVGQTGSFVHPKVYLTFGISGAIQHLAGIKSSQCIIAINNNLNSPIFQYCDYGICADANSIIRNLLQLLQMNELTI